MTLKGIKPARKQKAGLEYQLFFLPQYHTPSLVRSRTCTVWRAFDQAQR